MDYSFIDYQVIARLGAIPIEARQPMLGNAAGRHRSPLRGSSVEFAEYRKYVQGDDTRRLDWKAYARSDRYYIKEFEADTNLRAYMFVDTSGSMDFSFESETKIEYARKLAATLAYLTVDQGDAAGLSLCNEKTHLEMPPRRKASHIQNIFKNLHEIQPKAETGLVQGLHDIAEKIGSRAMIVVISDFFCDLEELQDALQHLRHKKHDVTLFHLMDPQEIAFDFERPHRFVDMEDNTSVVAEPSIIADEYREAVQEFLSEIKTTAFDANVAYRLVTTDENYEDVLSEFLLDRVPKGGKQ